MLVFILLLLLNWSSQVNCKFQDYWSDDYSGDKNCINKDLMVKLQNKEDEERGGCVTVSGDFSDTRVFDQCKTKLTKELNNRCLIIKEAGELLYCKSGKMATCCFSEPHCVQGSEAMDIATRETKGFLKNQTAWLEKEKIKGYASCHSLNSSYDASICQSDCSNYETSDFALQCNKKKGFFKCCVRRDNVFCHECRYCCTLLMCTVKEGEKGVHTYFSSIDLENLNVSNDTWVEQAKQLFYLTARSGGDHRCLNPYSDKDPTKWKIYDPVLLANATTKNELDKVPLHTFEMLNDNFNPEVIKQLTGVDFEKNWKTSHGVDFVSKSGDYGEVALDCYKAEKSAFAKKCRKNKGLFKCCATSNSLSPHVHLLRAANPSTSAYDKLCPDQSSCQIHTSHHICSTLDPFTNLVHLEFRTPLEGDLSGILIPDAEIKVGIATNTTYLEIRSTTLACLRMDTCSENIKVYNNKIPFLKATDKKSLCKLEQEENKLLMEIDLRNNRTIPNQEKEAVETYSDCLKRRYPSIRICPKKIFEKKKASEGGFKLYKSAMKKLWNKNKKTKRKEKKRKKKRNSVKKKRKSKKRRKIIRKKKRKKTRKNKNRVSVFTEPKQ